MRDKQSNQGITVNAIAGSYVVLLGWTIEESKREGLRGFAVKRTDPTEQESYWMKGTKTFKKVVEHPAPGEQFSSFYHPFQSFQWADYSAKPGRRYEYEIVAMYGDPKALTADGSVSITVETEPTEGAEHSVFFNRGSPATQEYARRFQNKPPSKAGPGAYEWLSRGLLESIINFIGRAVDGQWSLRGAFYEFQWEEVLKALGAARSRGVDVSIIFDDIENATGPWEENEAAIKSTQIGAFCIPRANGQLMHNKFLVLSKNQVPQALLFGSTNITENGIFGHANCTHIVEGEEPAKTYLKYWNQLSNDPTIESGSDYRKWNEDNTPAPETAALVPVFSPRPDYDALDWYAKLAGSADKGLFMTFAFGMNQRFADVYAKEDGILRLALMEKEWNGRNKEAQIAKVRKLQALPNVVIAIGNRIPLSGFDRWLGERDRVTSAVNVHWVHTKFMLVDPLGDDPTVITGSANFSEPSTTRNDENMLVITGNTRVADIYMGEFFRLHSHYAFRQAVAIFLERNPGATPDDFKQGYLIDDRDWTADYFTPGDKAARYLRRVYFSGG